ncbi:MAG: UDP-N-acetylmuramoyl-tripeptide--D-alanyl-D-alanine ligase [Elusimicrobiota bacterium]
MNITLQEIADKIQGRLINFYPPEKIQSISIDSRSIKKGQLFASIKGKNFDGHNFIKAAYQNGASASIVSEDIAQNNALTFPNMIIVKDTIAAIWELAKYYREKCNPKVIAITGSCGKTSVKDMLHYLLNEKFDVVATEGNLNNFIGVPLTIFRLKSDTEYCVVECGISEPSEMDILGRILSPDCAIITNVGYSHLEKLKNLDGVLAEKWKIGTYVNSRGLLLVNGDDALLKTKAENSKLKCQVKTFGLEPENTYFLKHIKSYQSAELLKFESNIDNITSREFMLPLAGEAAIYNCSAACSAARSFAGLSVDYIADRLEDYFAPSKMRFEKIDVDGVTIINDAYNANPNSVKEGLKTFEKIEKKGKKIVVLGDMLELGDFEEKAHRNIGSLVSNMRMDYIFCYGMAAKFIYEEICNLGFDKERVFWYNDKIKLITKIKSIINKNDLVYLKASRAMKFEEILEGIKR